MTSSLPSSATAGFSATATGAAATATKFATWRSSTTRSGRVRRDVAPREESINYLPRSITLKDMLAVRCFGNSRRRSSAAEPDRPPWRTFNLRKLNLHFAPTLLVAPLMQGLDRRCRRLRWRCRKAAEGVLLFVELVLFGPRAAFPAA